MEAKLGTNPSYIWRSIYGTLHLIKERERWRIVLGQQVGIWKEPWPLDPLDSTIQTHG